VAETSELEGVDSLRDAHVAALNAGDADAWVACFTSDAVQMPPNYPANVGIEEIGGWSGGMLTAFGAEFALSAEEVQKDTASVSNPGGGGAGPSAWHQARNRAINRKVLRFDRPLAATFLQSFRATG
jgi:ketosteroid isomerase-like protein